MAVLNVALRYGFARWLRPSLLCAAALGALWAIGMPRTADLAAQVYRVQLFARDGFAVWDNAWFAGHQLLDYSLISPGAGALLGLRPAGLLAVVVSVLCAEDLVSGLRPGSGPWPAVWFAVRDPHPIVTGAQLLSMGAQEIRLRFLKAGTADVAVHASSWWGASGGACVQKVGDFIGVTTTAPGLVRVDARFPPRSRGC